MCEVVDPGSALTRIARLWRVRRQRLYRVQLREVRDAWFAGHLWKTLMLVKAFVAMGQLKMLSAAMDDAGVIQPSRNNRAPALDQESANVSELEFA
jgi:hypothetical protein